jgi:hypothetical protein
MGCQLRRVHLTGVLCGIVLGATADTASADPEGGTVSGEIELADLAVRPELPVRSRGFTRRTHGPLKTPQKLDARDEIVVVLDGGPVAASDKKPSDRALRYEIIGESFATKVFPFVAGSKVEVKNAGHRVPRLYSPGVDGLIEETPLPDKGVRPIKKKLDKPYAATELRARDSAHLRGQLLPLPHAYFALVGDDGKYEIIGVPEGKWKIRLWYRSGWIQTRQPDVEVTANRTTKAPTLKLPAEINTSPPAEAN